MSAGSPYRDGSDGLRARARALRDTLRELGTEPGTDANGLLDQVAEIARLETAIERAERRGLRAGQRVRWMAGLVLIAVAVTGMFVGAQSELERLALYEALPRAEIHRAPIASRTAYAVWRGATVSSTADRPRLGASCELAASIRTIRLGVVRTVVRSSCAGLSSVRLVSDDCRVEELPTDAGWTYTLRCELSGEAGALRIDTTARSVTRVARDGRWTQIEVSRTSTPRTGEPLFPAPAPPGSLAFPARVRRGATVSRAIGRSGVRRGDRCEIDVVPIPSTHMFNCRIFVRCGSFAPFGTSAGRFGYQWCETRDGRAVGAHDGRAGTEHWPRWSQRAEDGDGDPMLALDLERRFAVVGHDLHEYLVYLDVDR